MSRRQLPPEPLTTNAALAARLEEAARLLEHQGANPYRVRAYRNAAAQLDELPVAASAIYADKGLAGLEEIHGVGPRIGHSLESLLTTGRFPLLDRLRGEADPADLLGGVPGIGPALSRRLHDELGITTPEGISVAAQDGRLARLPGIGPRRLAKIAAAVHEYLAGRTEPAGPPPPVGELLDVDRQYLDAAGRGELPTIAPRRFNRGRRAWLPILHTTRGERHYTALFSNTAQAHRLGRTRDWVVIYGDGDREEHQATVVTARTGALAGRRVVRGREGECLEYYRGPGPVQDGVRRASGPGP